MQRLRGLVVCALVGVLMLLPPVGTVPSQAAPGAVSSPAGDPRKPGDHAAEQAYLASLRRAPAGVSATQARADAVRQAEALPKLSALPASLDGQRPSANRGAGLQAPNGRWRPLGPATENSNNTNPNGDFQFGPAAGRGTAIAVGQHTGVIYLGTAGGGVWRSTNDGGNWTPLTDNQPSLAVGSLALDPADATDNTLYVGTGEANDNADAYSGVGVLKTTNGGQTWTLLGGSTFGPYSATSLAISALAVNGSTIFAGTQQFSGTRQGLYRSLDGGTTWARVTVAGTNTGAPVTDVQLNGTNLYVVLSYPFGPLTGAGVYLSADSGVATPTFTALATGLPGSSSWGRAQLAISPSAPQTFYLVIANSSNFALLGIYKTVNGGTSWAATPAQPANHLGDQGWYDLYIAVDPADPNLVYSGGTSVVRTTDGGASWSLIANVYCSGNPPCHAPIHPDQHAGAFGRSGTPRPFYDVNDGGIYATTNGSSPTPTWASRNGD